MFLSTDQDQLIERLFPISHFSSSTFNQNQTTRLSTPLRKPRLERAFTSKQETH